MEAMRKRLSFLAKASESDRAGRERERAVGNAERLGRQADHQSQVAGLAQLRPDKEDSTSVSAHHEEARAAHERAAAAFRAVGDKDQAARHSERAAEHEAARDEHGRFAGK